MKTPQGPVVRVTVLLLLAAVCSAASGAAHSGTLWASTTPVACPHGQRTLAGAQPAGPRAPSAAADLIANPVDRSGIFGDWQTLMITGTVSVDVCNEGDAPSTAFQVLFFEDRNRSGKYDRSHDQALRSAHHGRLEPGACSRVSGDVVASLIFRDNLIYALVDSENQVPESDEDNNLSHSGEFCERDPPTGGFEPVLEWEWTGSSTLPSARQAVVTPAVIDLDGDAMPDIVFVSFVGSPPTAEAYQQDGHLRAVSGDGKRELFTVTDERFDLRGNGGLAVGDIDSDGAPEIVAISESLDVLAFENDGTFKWRAERPIGRLAHPALADLDRDGSPEVIVGSWVYDSQGNLKWATLPPLGQGANAWGDIPIVADLNLSGGQEVMAGNTAYHHDGTVYWRNTSLGDGYNAVGNFDDDPFPEVVLVSQRKVYLLEHDGDVQWGPTLLPGPSHSDRNRGGPPTVADLDGDGAPEIGVAGGYYYTAIDTNGSIMWQSPIDDRTSNVTGSTVFDFDGDGAAEVVSSDEQKLRIYRGTDGTVLWETASSSSTQHEYPVVADVDADLSAEIVMVSNNFAWGQQNGIQVYGDADSSWVRTRQLWNQHAYHVTNILDDGTIPATEVPSWLTHNTYRLNLPETGSVFALPDPTASYLRVTPLSGLPGVLLTGRVGNGGAVALSPGMPVAFYAWDLAGPGTGPTLIGLTSTSRRLEIGEHEDVSVRWSAPPVSTVLVIGMVVNDDGSGYAPVQDCDQSNNYHSVRWCLPYLATATPTRIEPPSTTPTPLVTPTATPSSTPVGAATGTASPTTRPAATSTPYYSRCVCHDVDRRVPRVVIDDALANPQRFNGWLMPLDPGKPVSPANPLRECLALMNPALPYHPLWNKPVWRAGCP